jgi:hypothetical protein
MNERAIELYKQAIEFAYTSIGKEHADTTYFQGVVAGKFAELIVRECASIVADAVDQREPASTYVDKIKQHFGVEE